LILEQQVKIKWNGRTREHYENLGYVYTKKDDEFYVMAHELTPGSNIKVKFMCDYCGVVGIKRNNSLIKARGEIQKDCCSNCAPLKHNEVKIKRYGSLESEFPDIAKEWCTGSNKHHPREITPYSKKKAVWKCNKGHKWRAVVYSRTHADTGCPLCNESKGEKKVAKSLEELNVNYIREVSINDLIGIGGGHLRFDFAILNENGIIKAFIEYDGPFHYSSWYEGDNHERTVQHDKMKNEYCRSNNLRLYRIPYTSFDDIPKIVSTIYEDILLNN